MKWENVERREGVRRSDVKSEIEQMFLGQYRHSIDNKGRLTIPSRFRELLITEGAYVSQGFECNLMVRPVVSFEELSKKVNALSQTEPNSRLLKRLIFSTAEKVDVDKAGRILIPEFLRMSAGLEAETILVGAGDYFEIWAPETWNEQEKELQDAKANAKRFALLDL
jgi:MraZ protein